MEQENDLSREVSSKLQDTIQEIQDTTINLAIPGIFIAALIFHGISALYQNFLWSLAVGTSLLILTALLFLIRGKSFVLSAALVVAASFGSVFLTIWWGHFFAATILYIIPVGLSVLLFGIWGGMGMAALCSVLIFVILPPAGADLNILRITALMGIWAVLGMMWLALRPLLTVFEGAWAHYEQSRTFLRQAQDYQLQLKQTLENLKEANIQLTRLNQLTNGLRQIAEDERRAKEQFVANVSHELRTPLNMIIGFCEMILKSPQTYGRKIPSNLLADLEVVLRNSQHLSSLIDDVLDLSQIEAGQMALSKEPSSIVEIIQAATIAVRPLFESKGLYLNTEIQPDIPVIQCDRTRIREVLLNLLSNAGRFTEQGGVTVRAALEDSFVTVSIADTGKGISEQDKSKLFRPFQQLDGSIRRKYGGTGLGLSISKSFVELHDGKMWVESQAGKGTIFSFRLPVDAHGPMHSSFTRWINPYIIHSDHDRHSLPPIEVRPRIVVIDHEAELYRLLTRYLETSEIVRVDDLDQAVKVLEQTPARALVINDFEIPCALEKLNAFGTLPNNTPAILCSIPVIQPENEKFGVTGYLMKPISRENLLMVLEKLGHPVRTILIVDDEPDALQLFQRMLVSMKQGYRVLRAGNGIEALGILQEEAVDLILLDLLMPEMSGYEFMVEKNQNAAWKDIPVILISARDPQDQPLTSSALAVTRPGGLSIQQLLACLDALGTILSPLSQSAHPTSESASRG